MDRGLARAKLVAEWNKRCLTYKLALRLAFDGLKKKEVARPAPPKKVKFMGHRMPEDAKAKRKPKGQKKTIGKVTGRVKARGDRRVITLEEHAALASGGGGRGGSAGEDGAPAAKVTGLGGEDVRGESTEPPTSRLDEDEVPGLLGSVLDATFEHHSFLPHPDMLRHPLDEASPHLRTGFHQGEDGPYAASLGHSGCWSPNARPDEHLIRPDDLVEPFLRPKEDYLRGTSTVDDARGCSAEQIQCFKELGYQTKSQVCSLLRRSCGIIDEYAQGSMMAEQTGKEVAVVELERLLRGITPLMSRPQVMMVCRNAGLWNKPLPPIPADEPPREVKSETGPSENPAMVQLRARLCLQPGPNEHPAAARLRAHKMVRGLLCAQPHPPRSPLDASRCDDDRRAMEQSRDCRCVFEGLSALNVVSGGWSCSGCYVEVAPGDLLHGCRECGVDLCEGCFQDGPPLSAKHLHLRWDRHPADGRDLTAEEKETRLGGTTREDCWHCLSNEGLRVRAGMGQGADERSARKAEKAEALRSSLQRAVMVYRRGIHRGPEALSMLHWWRLSMLGRLGMTSTSNQAVVLAALNASLVNGAPPPTDDSDGMKDKDAAFANLDPAGEDIKGRSKELFDVASTVHPAEADSDLGEGQDVCDALLEETVVQAERGYRNKGERWIQTHEQSQVIMLRNMLSEKNTFCGGRSATPLIRCSVCGAEDGCDVSAAEGGSYCRPQRSTARSHPTSGRLSAAELGRACSSLTVAAGEMVLVRRNDGYERARLGQSSNTLSKGTGPWSTKTGPPSSSLRQI
jgi:hypothetical protein